MDLNLAQVRAFLAVHEHGGISAAARAIPTTQPTMTRLIRRLERALGCDLFDRHRGGCHLTPAGEVFLAEARALLAAADAAAEAVCRHRYGSQEDSQSQVR